jgi:DNA-binding response OmpR family regulator
MKSPEPESQRKLVLLVEDNVDALEIYGTSLRHAGYYVIEAPTLEEARVAVKALCPDVVVLDCNLPDGDGLNLLQTWRKAETPMANVPVIVLTASVHRQDVDAALLAGADLFVPKPCPGNVLALYVGQALDGKRTSARIKRVVR